MKLISILFSVMFFFAFLLVVFFELFDIDISGLVLPLLWILVVFGMYLSVKRIFSWRKDNFETKDDTDTRK